MSDADRRAKSQAGPLPVLPVYRPDLSGNERAYVLECMDSSWISSIGEGNLFLSLVLIEVADVIFAVDSVPAIFAITTDPFIVYTSNVFAILGLRALYFALAEMIHRFRYLKPALAIVLIFIGSKIFVADLLGLEKFPASLSLGITFAIIASGVIWSLVKTRDTRAGNTV